MDTVAIQSPDQIGRNFIPSEFLPKGRDEYYLRNQQTPISESVWRHLASTEVEYLVKNGNRAADWDDIWVTDEFNPEQVNNTEFFGQVRIGRLSNKVLSHHDLHLPVGIYNSKIISCDIGNDSAIHNVQYLAFYIIGERCILANIDEMNTTNHSKFGNGIVKDGEPEDVRVWLDIMNETGCRQIMPFDGMLPADAYLWAKYRDDQDLLKKLGELTQNQFDSRRGYYGMVGTQSVIKNSRIIKDVKIGSHCYIKGANKIKNLTINSTSDESTQIGEGVELVNGIIGVGCHIFYGCKAVRFILGPHSSLKYGARLINSYLGDNSTISCCEVLNNLIFPAHEQHHNNSFLIASVVKGQSNLAAGATIGSNHNSRANDNEIEAGRGFWPGLCTSVKHSSKFASFTLLAKADFPAELNIPLPFSLVNNNVGQDQLEVLPAFWWLYNMYALARNSWKFTKRDKRKFKRQHIEYDSLAPDTVEEIFRGRELLEWWTGKALARTRKQKTDDQNTHEYISLGRQTLAGSKWPTDLKVTGENMEKSSRRSVVLKPLQGYKAYGDMLCRYAVNNIMDFMFDYPEMKFQDARARLSGDREKKWMNIGGQLIRERDVDQLRKEIRSGKLSSWANIHKRYDELWENYPLLKQQHAFATLCEYLGTAEPSDQQWLDMLDKALHLQEYVRDQVFISREKDYENPFRQATFRNMNEMLAAIGTVEDNSFIKQVREETETYKDKIKQLQDRE
ncbi:MAG: DUF4954 family protein [candidate division KSB1 bacterium]|nr:DUF4954 family protein [candidate division KSB1 bacterium]